MAELEWTGEGPRSTRFDDVYFQLEDGLAESRAVFLAGCGLPQRFAGRAHFCVGELGFGSGLNVLALLDLWRRHRPSPEARLHMVSIEAYPMTADEAARALSAFPELAELAADLLGGWPDGRVGPHWIDFPELGATLQIMIGEVAPALKGLDARMDAWFLDGFAPSKNPDMWSDAVLARVAALSAPGCIAATFTVAGDVRRRLQAGGFEVEKRPGFGRKRQRLEAVMPGDAPVTPAPRIAIIGAGIAGASLMRAFRRAGLAADLFDTKGMGAGASGNPAALISPRLDAGLGDVAQLHAQAYARAIQIYRTEAMAALIGRGALQLERGPKDASRFDVIAAWDGWSPGGLTRSYAVETTRRLTEPASAGALRMRDALVLEPAVVLSVFAGDAPVAKARVTAVEADGTRWRVTAGGQSDVYDVVCLTAGFDTGGMTPLPDLLPVRGQVTTSKLRMTGEAAAWGGYVIPTRTGLLFGATHQRGDADAALREADDQANLTSLATVRPALAEAVAAKGVKARAAIRAATPDHMPLSGQAAPGLFLLTALGGRGFTLAPLLAEQIAAEVAGAPHPLSLDLVRRVDPQRYSPSCRPAPTSHAAKEAS